jgi:hypothetical protein
MSSLSELDILHQETMDKIRDYNYSDILPSGQLPSSYPPPRGLYFYILKRVTPPSLRLKI